MENLVVAVIILAVLLVFTGVNSFIICNSCEEISSFVNENAFDEAVTRWESRKNYIALFVRDSEIDIVDEQMEELFEVEDGDERELESAKNELLTALTELKQGEAIGWQQIF